MSSRYTAHYSYHHTSQGWKTRLETRNTGTSEIHGLKSNPYLALNTIHITILSSHYYWVMFLCYKLLTWPWTTGPIFMVQFTCTGLTQKHGNFKVINCTVTFTTHHLYQTYKASSSPLVYDQQFVWSGRRLVFCVFKLCL